MPKKPKPQVGKITPKANPRKPAAVGTGAFALPPSADKRLEPRTGTVYPSGPVPTDYQLQQSESVVTPERLYYYKLTRFSPIRILTPELLGQYLDLYEQGYIRWFALMQWYIAQRDPILSTVMPKRYGSVKRIKWQIVVEEDLDPSLAAEAEKHKQALFKFYQNLRSTSAVDLNQNSGMSNLIEQMMSAIAYRWAVHELIWKPMADGNLTAQFNFIPLWFFENRSGKLRFTETDYQLEGRDLKPGSFMTTVGPGIMRPCAVAYLYKSLAMKWWLAYIENHASPLRVGKTNAARGTANWNDMRRALQMAVDSILLAKDEEIENVSVAATGELPYLPMVEDQNRMMATLWRGADLSTMSGRTSNGGQGALLQAKEEYFLQCDDAARLNEVFNFQIDAQVIGWHFGEGTRPLAYFKLVVPPNIEASTDIAIMNALISWGLAPKIGQKQTLEHFGWQERLQSDQPITPIQPPAPGGSTQNPGTAYTADLDAANERFDGTREEQTLAEAQAAFAMSTAEALAPLRDGVLKIVNAANENRLAEFRNFRRSLPGILRSINRDPKNAQPLADALSSSWFRGLAASARARGVR